MPTDVDECADDSTNNCSQRCLNNDGSYSCSCDDGYNLDDSGACQGEVMMCEDNDGNDDDCMCVV